MKVGFEDKFMDIQAGLIELCLEALEDTKVDKIFAYAFIGDRSNSFNVFFGRKGGLFNRKGTILTASQVIEASLLPQVFKLASEDLDTLRSVCTENEAPCPVEMKMYYDCNTRGYHAAFVYDLAEYYAIYESPYYHFKAWMDEIAKLGIDTLPHEG